ncbi:hypothetical protein QE193_23405 (plasmid) [Arsenophonus nasoniae]|nr:hypothetical protein [Arsenophonus nasoniae]WGM18160.1 hypothetical protein QE193_23405 [Arsenophonus nasoniae]
MPELAVGSLGGKMKQIKFYLTDEQYVQAEVMAKSKGFKSVNQMAKEKTLKLDNVKTSFEVSKEQKVTRTTVSLYEYESTALESYAKAHGRT